MNISKDDYIRLTLLIKDIKRNIDNENIYITDSELKYEFIRDLEYFYKLFNLR